MASKAKTSYQIFYEEQYKILKNKGVVGNEATKEIGRLWSNLTPQERKPYEDKKKEFDVMILREQEVMKAFSKKKGENTSNETDKQKKTNLQQTQIPKKQVVHEDINESNKDSDAHNKRFTKDKLKKDIAEPTKKVLIQKVDEKGKVIASNQQDQQLTSKQQPIQKQQPQQQPKKVEQASQSQQKPAQKLSQQLPQKKPEEQKTNKALPNQGIDHRKANHEVYIQFYKSRLATYKNKFPNRKTEELTKAIKEEWSCYKLASKIEEKEKKLEIKFNKKNDAAKEKAVVFQGQQVEVPKRPISGFMRYYKDVNHEIKQKQPALAQNEVAKQASEQWKSLSKDQQDKYNNEFQKEKAEYDKKKQEFYQKYNQFPKDCQKESKKNKIYNKNFLIINGSKVFYPLRLGGYFVYQKQAREQLKTRKSQYTPKETSIIIGSSWKKLSAEQREQFEKQSELEYEQQKEAFISKYGEFPEQPKKEKPKPVERVKKQVKSEPKKLNVKRPAPSKKVEPEISMEEKEELLNKKLQRKMQINYDDVDSEIEDIYSQIEESDQRRRNEDSEEEEEEGYGKYYGNKISLKTKGEEEFEKIERYFTKPKQIKTEKEAKQQSKPSSVSKSKNILFEMLNEPIPIPDFVYGPSFF